MSLIFALSLTLEKIIKLQETKSLWDSPKSTDLIKKIPELTSEYLFGDATIPKMTQKFKPQSCKPAKSCNKTCNMFITGNGNNLRDRL